MSTTPDAPKRVLVTGAAGVIGRALRDELHQRYRLRLMYHRTVLPQQGRERGDCGRHHGPGADGGCV